MQLVEFKPEANAVSLVNEKFHMTGSRLMSASEYKKANGVKGNDAKITYNAYLKANGVNANANLSAMMARGEVLITSFKEYQSGKLQIVGIKSASLVDPAPKKESGKITQADALAALGLTAEDLAKLIAK